MIVIILVIGVVNKLARFCYVGDNSKKAVLILTVALKEVTKFVYQGSKLCAKLSLMLCSSRIQYI